MSNDAQAPRLRQMKESLKAWDGLSNQPIPAGGWIRSIRQALGMSAGQLGARLGLSRQGVADLERREVSRGATLATLEKAAEALNADLVYAIIPRTSLSKMLRKQARKRAEEQVAAEAPGLSSEEHEQRVDDLQERLLRDRVREIWDEKGRVPPEE